MGPLILLFWTSGNVSPGFQSQFFLVECQDTFSLRGKEYGCEGSLVKQTHNQEYSRQDCENHCLKGNRDNCTGYFYLAHQTSGGTDYYCYNYQTAPLTILLTKQGNYYERNPCHQCEYVKPGTISSRSKDLSTSSGLCL